MCKADHVGQWVSCEKYVNNLLVVTSVLFTGNQFAKYFSQCDSINLANISETTYNDYQACNLFPTVQHWWDETTKIMHKNFKDEPVVVAGDGQMDSPGYCVKYCVYTMMHELLNYILNMDVTDVSEADRNSACMESWL